MPKSCASIKLSESRHMRSGDESPVLPWTENCTRAGKARGFQEQTVAESAEQAVGGINCHSSSEAAGAMTSDRPFTSERTSIVL